ncbi:MAG TPA: hypothetical protein VF762_21410, partial [Blastocatellia bacterium]
MTQRILLPVLTLLLFPQGSRSSVSFDVVFQSRDRDGPFQTAPKDKKDDFAGLLERLKSRSSVERRDALDKLAETEDSRAVEP